MTEKHVCEDEDARDAFSDYCFWSNGEMGGPAGFVMMTTNYGYPVSISFCPFCGEELEKTHPAPPVANTG